MWKDWKRAPCITAAYFISLRVVCNVYVCVCVSVSRAAAEFTRFVFTVDHVRCSMMAEEREVEQGIWNFYNQIEKLEFALLSMLFNLFCQVLKLEFFFFFLNDIIYQKESIKFLFANFIYEFFFLSRVRFFVAIARVERNRFPSHFEVPALAYKLQDSN